VRNEGKESKNAEKECNHRFKRRLTLLHW